MTQLFHNPEPFDILFRNFFDTNAFFEPAIDSKPKYPVDIYDDKEGLHFDIAVVGLGEEDLQIEVKDGNTLTVVYEKEAEDEKPDINWINQGIAQRSFSLGWKIGAKYELDQIEAVVDKGLLSIFVPIAPDKKPKMISFKKKSKK